MNRRAFALAALVTLAGQLVAQTPGFPPMHPKGMAVGHKGELKGRYRIVEVIDGKSAEVAVLAFPDLPFIVKGFDTSRLADGSETMIPGEWTVAGKEKRGGRTLFVVEPQPADKGKR